MSDRDTPDKEARGFVRPWETDEEERADIVPLPGMNPEEADKVAGSVDPDRQPAPDEVEAADLPPSVSDYTSEEYIAATTKEYEGLAEDVSRAAGEEWEQQAVAATLPGVESGLVGFEDVSGTRSESEESLEGLEQAATSDLTLRVASALVIGGLFLGSLLLGGWWFTIFVILVMVVSAGEFYATLRTKGYQPLALFGLLGVVLMGVGAHNWGIAAIAGWASASALVIVLFFSLTSRRNPLENSSITILGMAWAGMLAFAIPIGLGPHPVAQIFFIVLVVALNDIGAYFVGRTLGRRPFAPNISPNKTIEGFFGGLIAGGVTASILVAFPPWEPIGLLNGLIIALVVGTLGPIGDLAESMVKRSIGVKDMGSVLPGHGGMLDRIDAFLFVVPAAFFLYRAFELL